MQVVINPNVVIMALCRMYGRQQGNGGYELFIPADILNRISPTGELRNLPAVPTDPPGLRFVYSTNTIIEGTLVKPEPKAPVAELEPVKPDENPKAD